MNTRANREDDGTVGRDRRRPDGAEDGLLSIEHYDDDLLNGLDGLEKSVALLNGVMPTKPADYTPQAI